MPAIFDLLYREYCRARLAEMRKQLLISTESQAVPEANRDVDYLRGSASPDSGFGGDRTGAHLTPIHFWTIYLLVLLSVPATTYAQTAPTFYVHSYGHSYGGNGGKCLDFGPPPQVDRSPVFIFDCNGTVAQQVRVEEVNDRHDVILRAGTKVIGVPRSTAPAEGAATESELPLELQSEASRLTVLSLGQIFALDGDSIMLATNRSRVVKVQGGRGKTRTPLLLGHRDLADSEFWTFTATDGTARKLTSGFVRVSQGGDFGSAVLEAKWGTVIEIDPDASPIDLTHEDRTLNVPAGVTIRGDRGGVRQGAEISSPFKSDNDTSLTKMLTITGSDVRITGLRLRGPSRGRNHNLQLADGIFTNSEFNTIVDHNDMSDWTNAAVEVSGGVEGSGGNDSIDCTSLFPPSRPEKVRVVRNFLHHNERWGFGYGVAIGGGGYAFIEGNTFVGNRHAITDDGTALSGYRAWFNLVLSDVPTYSADESGNTWGHGPQQDFDMHGTDPSSGSEHEGGVAGAYLEIARNTFLATGENSRPNLDLRGTPCYLAEFHSNVTLENLSTSILDKYDTSRLIVTDNNRFGAPNPTYRLGVGDFDGDGKDDLFLATGAAWYYAPAGTAEWRYLNDMTEELGSLLFGDFDADGRTDVFMQRGREWFVSWGGASPWEKINESDAQMTDFVIGDFVGDRRADVFYARGDQWFVSDGGVGPFDYYASSGFRIPDLRFGDFDSDHKTDILAVENNEWSVVYARQVHEWKKLRAKLSDKVDGLFIADFDGNGRSDIATFAPATSDETGVRLKVSRDGTGDWKTLRGFRSSNEIAATGRFDDNPGADILTWNNRWLDIVSSGSAEPQRHSRQDMR